VVITAFSVAGEGEFGGGNAEEEDEDLGHHGYMVSCWCPFFEVS
jgi:hypothetical protein